MNSLGGGSTEASFSSAPEGSINKRIWDSQLSKSQRFRVKSAQLFPSLMAEAKTSAILTTLSVVRNQIAENPEFGCDVVVETAKVGRRGGGTGEGQRMLENSSFFLQNEKHSGITTVQLTANDFHRGYAQMFLIFVKER